ncbi:S53 family peptidase [Microbacterium sp. ASV49]|uniref:S53 family peptidase n=1 Tax=Microbacterium candidum TaxID=3041922 RepID=A0ABT7N338_9MICO|nr:S53 family peptidase [Microbacterium sp. ASV49]MDL9981126.1 S53 family peptidase [Microbacterium sp. ASV49]
MHGPLPGSEREPIAGTSAQGAVPADQQIDATLVLRRKAEVPAEVLEHPIPSDEFARLYGADQADADAVAAAVEAAGAQVVSVDLGGRLMRIRGTASVVQRLFGADLQVVADGTGTFRQRTGPLSLPADLHGRVTAVLGLDDRPQAEAHFRVLPAAAAAVSYTPVQVGAMYQFPPGTDGTGRTVAIIELGGGFAQADLDAYFSGLGIPTPTVTAVGVDGASNVPGQDPNGADGEVLLDIEVVGALAPGAHIIVYFAPNTDAGFLDAVTTAAHATPTPDAISISWGQSEDAWTAQARTAMDSAFVDAAGMGVTVTAAAGDNGSGDGAIDATAHADFPASSPHVLACGGTTLHGSGSTISSETVWNDGSTGGATGGGVSDVFPIPSWQSAVGVPTNAGGTTGRGVPDVAGDADPQTGYKVRVDGSDLVIGGTSAVAPLWAALVARLVQATGTRTGLIQPKLYAGATGSATAPGFRDITSGSNGAFGAKPGWDACTGLGSPVGASLLTVLGGAATGGGSTGGGSTGGSHGGKGHGGHKHGGHHPKG